MVYTYSIKQDFPNKSIDLNSLIVKIQQNNLPLNNLVIIDDSCEIHMLLTLTTQQKNVLDFIISTHTGNPLPLSETVEKVKILEEEVNGTTGHFQSQFFDIEIPTQTGVYTKDFIFPYNISLFSAEWNMDEKNIGDTAEFHISPDKIVGVTMRNHKISDTILYVSDTVLENIHMGYYVKIGGIEYGRVLNVNKENKTITIEKPLGVNISSGSPVLMTIKIVPHFRFTCSGHITVGGSKIGSDFIPANTIMRIVYTNNNGIGKWYGISMDYLY